MRPLQLARLATIALAGLAVLRAQRELLRGLLGAGVGRLEPGVGWSTAAWFLPIANLFLPLRSFRQLATVSGPGRRAALDEATSAWWTLWLAGLLVQNFGRALGQGAETPPAWLTAAGLGLLGDGLLIGAGLLLRALLHRLADEQAELGMLLGALPGETPRFADAAALGLWWEESVARPSAP